MLLKRRKVRKLSSLSSVITDTYGESLSTEVPLEVLRDRLLKDLSLLDLPVGEVDLSLRPYSKTYYGNYFPDDVVPRVWLYPYSDEGGRYLSYDKILETGIHEMCHHIQYSDPDFKRKRGVMHDPQFWKLYNHYIKRAVSMKLLGEKYVKQAI